jgi:hypothetical protein
LLDFVLGEDTGEEALTVFLVDLAHALDLDNIDTYRHIHSLGEMKGCRQTSCSCWPEEPIRRRLSWPVH